MSGRRRSGAEDDIRRGFLGMALCHELKQPLHSLNLNIELLGKRLAKANVAASEIDGPMAALGRVVDRINDCLDAFGARIVPDSIPQGEVALLPLLDAAVGRARERARKAGITITMQAPDDLPEIQAHPEQLAVALDAVIDNALKASSAGGQIVVSGTHSDDDVRIEVSDRGTGMTPDVARRAIEIGFSTWGGGGIGLTVAKFITYHHAGAFQVSSTPGQGTTVSMTLPAT